MHLFDDNLGSGGAADLYFGYENTTGSDPNIRGTFGVIRALWIEPGAAIDLEGPLNASLCRVFNDTLATEIGLPVAVVDFDGTNVPELFTQHEANLRGTVRGIELGDVPSSGLVGLSTIAETSAISPADSTRINHFGAAMIADGDWDGDGAPDLAIASPYHSFPFGSTTQRGMVGVAFGNPGGADYATARVPAGLNAWRGIGGRCSPRARLWVRRLQNTSAVQVYRQNTAPAAVEGALPSYWLIDTAPGTSGEVRIRATDAELSGRTVDRIMVFRAEWGDGLDGPWVPLPTTRTAGRLFEAPASTLKGIYTLVEQPERTMWAVE